MWPFKRKCRKLPSTPDPTLMTHEIHELKQRMDRLECSCHETPKILRLCTREKKTKKQTARYAAITCRVCGRVTYTDITLSTYNFLTCNGLLKFKIVGMREYWEGYING